MELWTVGIGIKGLKSGNPDNSF